MSPKDNRIQSFVSKLRSSAESLRAGKTIAAEAFVVGVDEGLNQYDGIFNFAGAMVRMYQTATLATRKVLANPTVRTMTQRLVANVVDDIASRTNEVATLIEAAAKEPTVIDAVNDFEAAAKEFEAAAERFRKLSRRRSAHKFTVVRDDEGVESEEQDKTHPMN